MRMFILKTGLTYNLHFIKIDEICSFLSYHRLIEIKILSNVNSWYVHLLLFFFVCIIDNTVQSLVANTMISTLFDFRVAYIRRRGQLSLNNIWLSVISMYILTHPFLKIKTFWSCRSSRGTNMFLTLCLFSIVSLMK